MDDPRKPWCGAAGWQAADWAELRNGFGGRRPAVLEVLAQFVDCVEIDSTRDGPLKPESAHVWLRRVAANPRFQFNPVLARQFTHDRNLRRDDVLKWIEGIRPLFEAGKLGCLVMEFPWAFRFTVENRAHLIELRRTFRGFPLVAEFRHESWLREEAQGTLIDFRVGFVNVDQPAYFRAMPPTALLTSPVGYVRLHGRTGVEWFRDFAPRSPRPSHLYAPEALNEWTERIEKLQTHAGMLYIAATDPNGMLGLLHALRLRSLLEREFHRAPPALLKRYWDELAGFSAAKPVQGSLSPAMLAVA